MAMADETRKNTSNDWAFVSEHIQGSDADSDGNFLDDTMMGFSKHGTLALTFHVLTTTAGSSAQSASNS